MLVYIIVGEERDSYEPYPENMAVFREEDAAQLAKKTLEYNQIHETALVMNYEIDRGRHKAILVEEASHLKPIGRRQAYVRNMLNAFDLKHDYTSYPFDYEYRIETWVVG